MLFLWKPSHSEIEDCRVSISRRKLTKYIEDNYAGYNPVFSKCDEDLISVNDKQGYVLDYIGRIPEL